MACEVGSDVARRVDGVGGLFKSDGRQLDERDYVVGAGGGEGGSLTPGTSR